MYDCHIIITILPKSLKYNLPPSFMSNADNLSSSFKDFPPLERKMKNNTNKTLIQYMYKTVQQYHSSHTRHLLAEKP